MIPNNIIKNLSRSIIFFIILVLAAIRLHYTKWESERVANILTWDAFGYYLPLPACFIYHDIKKMEWVPEIVNRYQSTGPLYQLSALPNGNKAMKYFLGISILYSPFFIMGHLTAGILDCPQDGFSAPYQLSICLAALFYAFIGLWALRWVLLRYFSDKTTALTLILVALATNYVQYVSVDSAQTHGFIFTLYAWLMVVTIQWHNRPTLWKAFLLGGIIGLGILSRPTEAVMIFIPLLYGTSDKISKKNKWLLVKQNPWHIITAFAGGWIALMPQFIYWKVVTGKWIYDVGSKWTFLDPNWQVLFGWEKGWFIYTPVTLLMVAGLFLFRRNTFYWSVLIYFLINTWIVIAWDDWRYGASYSSRALVQSYAVMSLPLAALIGKFLSRRFNYLLLIPVSLLVLVNLFQIWQYNKTILHYNDMNRRYYQAIFLNPNPTPWQMSLMDTEEYISNEKKFNSETQINIDSTFHLHGINHPEIIFLKKPLRQITEIKSGGDYWLKISALVKSDWGAYDSHLITRLIDGEINKTRKIRLHNGLHKLKEWNQVGYYFKISGDMTNGTIEISARTASEQDIYLRDISIVVLIPR